MATRLLGTRPLSEFFCISSVWLIFAVGRAYVITCYKHALQLFACFACQVFAQVQTSGLAVAVAVLAVAIAVLGTVHAY